MNNHEKKWVLDLIRSNIAKYGHHLYLIQAETVLRFAYTVGVSNNKGRQHKASVDMKAKLWR